MRDPSSRMGRALHTAGRHRTNPMAKVAARAARAFLAGFDERTTDRHEIATNGEGELLRRLGPRLTTVFDVGANVGDWTEAALAAGAHAVHAFEIAPSTARHLGQRFGNDARVTVNPVGLGERPGSVTIHHYPDHPRLSTITDYPHKARSEPVEARVDSGSRYVAARGIDRIDLLKMDVEGAEPGVLEGFRTDFDREAIGSVQFEYGRVSILTHFLLGDFYKLLNEWGFALGRIEPAGVRWLAYSFDLEDFKDTNYLAVHRSRPDLRRALEGWSPPD